METIPAATTLDGNLRKPRQVNKMEAPAIRTSNRKAHCLAKMKFI